MTLPIEDYAVLGDTRTVALVGRNGSVDWLCLPRFDSHAAFAALLGDSRNGRWLLGPVGAATTTRRYLGDSFVLETTHRTESGTVKVTDLMPVAGDRADVIRRVEGITGTVRMRHEWVVRFEYGKVRPWVARSEDADGRPMVVAAAGPDKLALRGTRLPKAQGGKHLDEFDVRAGETLQFTATWVPSHLPVPGRHDAEEQIAESQRSTQHWAAQCQYEGPYRDEVLRSVLVLHLLTHGGTGGIVAAATTSLPEEFGGERNWDYRYCWLRDASLTLQALLLCGYHQEAVLWRDWLMRALGGDPEDMQIMYAVDGARDLFERELDHLSGYAGSRPVRIGNGAATQLQTDVLGEVMAALSLARREGVEVPSAAWSKQRVLIDHLAANWETADHGMWEMRGPEHKFTHSRVMVWVAFDRAIKAVERHGLPGDADRWRGIRDKVRAEVLDRGFNRSRGCFRQHYDTDEVDASLLLIPVVGFLPGDDPRVLGTVAAVEQDLMRDGLLMRYRTSAGIDGLKGDENPFLACSFWLVMAYALAGRGEDARVLMDRLVSLANDVGLLSEEYDPAGGRMAGNFPQAFSHLALIHAAIVLNQTEGGEAPGGASSRASG
ncbi:MAG TPA: glycoside hydrolase family 15 protein [Nocardioidaceae bacterium]|nr:glycoside hydrolase family 15 protein [Nocardioidaceae bacterium]